MTTDPAAATARVRRRLSAPPGEVYDAWLDETVLAGFISPAPGSAVVAIDPRVGGSLRIVMSFPDRRVVIEGAYLVLDRPSRISFTWRVDAGGIDSVVTVTLEPAGRGQTEMTIVHSRLPAPWVESYDTGWSLIADQLARRTSG
jgi:uncharacterized protein YndB with AHSA1/START domain